MTSNYPYQPNSEAANMRKMMTEEDYFYSGNQGRDQTPPRPFDWFDRGPAYRERQAALKALQSPPASGTRENPTVIAPSRTSAFSRNDAQTLSALDPTGALLKRADAMASDDRFKQNLVTGRNETTGESFTMQPANRIDGKTLGIMGAQFMQEKLQAQKDAELAGTRKHQTDMISLPLASNERVTNSRIAGDKDMAGLEIAGRKTEADATRAYNLPGQTLQNAGLATANAAGKLALEREKKGLSALQASLDKNRDVLSRNPAGRAMLADSEANLMKGYGVDPTIAGNLATAAQASTPEHTAAVLDSPIMKPQVDAFISFAKQLSQNSLLGFNMQTPNDMAALKRKKDVLIQAAEASGADKQTIMNILATRLDTEIPRELTSFIFSGIPGMNGPKDSDPAQANPAVRKALGF